MPSLSHFRKTASMSVGSSSGISSNLSSSGISSILLSGKMSFTLLD